MRRRLLAWSLIATGIVYAFFIGGTPAGTELPELRLVTALVVGAAGATWGIAAWKDPSWRPRSVLLPGILAGLASMGLSTITSRAPRVSVEYLAYAVILAALYLLLGRLMTRPFYRDRIVAVASLTGIAIAGLFAGAVVSRWISLWLLVGRITTPPLRPGHEGLVFGNPAPVLVMSVLLGSIAVGWAAGTGRRRQTAVALIVFLGATAVLLSGVRGGWFAIGVAVLGTSAVALLRLGRGTAVAGLRSWLFGPGKRLLAAAVGVGLLAIVALGPGIILRIAAGGEDLRGTFYRIAVQMFGEAPVVGVGPGMWVAQRMFYTQASEVDQLARHAHDLYLQGLAEMGIVGALAGLILATLLVWLLRDALRDADPVRRRWGWIATFTSIYFAAHHLVDFYANLPTTLLAFAIPIALLDATATRSPARLPDRLFAIDGRRALGVTVIVLTSAIAAAVAFEIPALRHAQAVKLANQGDWADAYPLAQSAAAMDPEMPIYQLTAGLAAAHAGEYAEAAQDLRVIAEAGDLPEAWLDLADAEMHLGDVPAAHAALGRALRLGDQRGAVAVPASEIALRLGDDVLATQAITRSIISLPGLAEERWWQAEPGRRAAFEEAVAAASQQLGPTLGWQLALLSGVGDPRGQAAGLPANERASAVAVIAAWSGDRLAVVALEERCIRSPLDSIVTWCARVAAKFDRPQADRFQEWARIVGWEDQLFLEFRVETDPARLAVAGAASYLYGVEAYRRSIPWDIVAPGLIHLTLQ